MNYEKDIEINESALDVEWLQQATLTYQYSKIAAEAKRTLDKHKEKLDIKKAEIDRKIRETPEKFGLVKLTETVISNTIIQQEEYSEMNMLMIDAKYELEMAMASTRALQDKKSALENLVKLHGQNYFAGPSVPRDLSKEWEAEEKQKKSNGTIRMTRKEKKD